MRIKDHSIPMFPTRISIFFIPLLLFLAFLSPQAASSADYSWEFDSGDGFAGWHYDGAQELSIEDGSLVLKGRTVKLISPPGVDIPGSKSVLWLRLKSPRMMIAAVGLESINGRIFKKTFRAGGSEGYRDYRIYLGDTFGPEDMIYSFVVQVRGGYWDEGEASIDFIRFYEPSALGLAGVWWQEFWEPDILKASTINFVTTPKSGPVYFPAAIYIIVIFLAVLIIIALYLKKAPALGGYVKKAVIAAFLTGAALFSLRMDYNWLVMWKDDASALSGRDVRGRTIAVFSILAKNFDDFYGFLEFVKRTVPEGERVSPAAGGESTYVILAKYFLMPVLTSDSAKYLWSYNDGLVYDPGTHSLMQGTTVIASPVRLVAPYGERAALYEKEGVGIIK